MGYRAVWAGMCHTDPSQMCEARLRGPAWQRDPAEAHVVLGPEPHERFEARIVLLVQAARLGVPPICRNEQVVLGHCCGAITLSEGGELPFPVHMVEAMPKVQVDPACAGQCLIPPVRELAWLARRILFFGCPVCETDPAELAILWSSGAALEAAGATVGARSLTEC